MVLTNFVCSCFGGGGGLGGGFGGGVGGGCGGGGGGGWGGGGANMQTGCMALLSCIYMLLLFCYCHTPAVPLTKHP